MNSLNKPKVLLVPAWYPASFFSEQMGLINDLFDFKILTGTRTEYGKKKAAKEILSGKFHWFSSLEKKISESETLSHITYSYINHLPTDFELKQYKYLNNHFEEFFNNLIQIGWKPDLIHIQSLSDTAVFICNWAIKHKIPIILTEHLFYIRTKFDFFQKEKERVYSKVNKVLCVSNYVHRNLLMNGFKLKNVEIIGNLVEDKFVPESFNKIKIDNKILFVATHFADKDIDVLLRAVKILTNTQFTDFKIDIIGIDPNQYYQNESNANYLLKREITTAGLSEYFDIKGIMTKDDLLKAYKNYSILVSTSLSETFGLSVAEAIINGLPVICTDSGGIRDFVDHTNGIIVPIRNPRAFADAIKEMFEQRAIYNSEAISNCIRKSFGQKAFRARLIRIYEELTPASSIITDH